MVQQMAKAGGPPKNQAQMAAFQKKLAQQGGGANSQMAQAMKMLKGMMGGAGMGGEGGMPAMAAMQNMMASMGLGPGGMARGGGRR